MRAVTTPTAPALVDFGALGTYVHLRADADPRQLEASARDVLDEIDRACSRFRSDSDLARVNADPGHWVPVSPVLAAAVEVALTAAATTDGLVDPCLGRPLVELGYDRDLALVRSDPGTPNRAAPIGSARPGAWRAVEHRADAVRIPNDVSLDLGATAKAWAADLLATELAEEFGGGVLVSLGGDVRTVGPGPADGWSLAVTEFPYGDGDTVPAAEVCLDSGGLATSSTRVRRWRHGDIEVHHLLDPRTGQPVRGPWRTVTATGPTCVAANVATTAALVLGDEAVDWLEERRIDARLVGHDDTVVTVGSWPREVDPC